MDSLKHPRRPWATNGVTQRATPSVRRLEGRIEALAVFSAEAHGTYADPSTLFVHGLRCHRPLPHNAGYVARAVMVGRHAARRRVVELPLVFNSALPRSG